MIQTPASYNPYAASRRVEIETELHIVDDAAAGNATVTAPDVNAAISAVSTFATDERTGMGGRFFTLEPDYAACDKVFDIMPDDYRAGLWGEDVAGVGGDIAAVIVDFVFSAPVNCMGLSMWFDPDAEEWPENVRADFHTVTPRSGAEDTPDDPPIDVFPSAPFSVLMFPANAPKSFTHLTLTITPRASRRVRLAGVSFGIVDRYTGARITAWDYNTEADITAAALPSASQSVTVLADNGQFSLVNPALLPFIHPGLAMKTAVLVNGVRVPLSDTILQSVTDNGDGTATIKSADAVLQLDSVFFRSASASDAPEWASAGAFTAAVMAATAGLRGATAAGIPFTIPTARASETLFPHREAASVRAWITAIAQALRLHVFLDRAGVLRFVDVSPADVETPETVDAVTAGNSINTRTETENRVNYVEIVSAIPADDDEIRGYYAEITNRYTGETERAKTLGNSLVTRTSGTAAALWALEQANRRVTYKADWRGNPALDLFDCVSVNGRPAIVAGLNYSFSGYFKSTITAAAGLFAMMDGVTTRAWEGITWKP